MYRKRVKLLSLFLSLLMVFGAVASVGAAGDGGTHDGIQTVYFKDTNCWQGKFADGIYAYLFSSAGSDNNGYPGQAMTYLGRDADQNRIYSIEVETAKYDTIKFTNGAQSGTVNRTDNYPVAMTDDNNGYGFTGNMTSGNKYFEVAQCKAQTEGLDITEPTEPTGPSEPDNPDLPDSVTIYFKDTNCWGDGFVNGIYAYLFSSAGSDNNGYPGVKMQFIGRDVEKNKVYSVDVDTTKYDTIKFSDGSASNKRTNNFPIALSAGNNGYQFNGKMDPDDTRYYGVEQANIDTDNLIVRDEEDVTVYFADTASWGLPYAYVLSADDSQTNGAYPGEAMAYEGKDAQGVDVYSYTFNFFDYAKIKFSNGKSGSSSDHKRTGNLEYRADLTGEMNAYRLTGNADPAKPSNLEAEACAVDTKSLDSSDLTTVYFRDDLLWADVYAYTFSSANGNTSNGPYPGQKMEYAGKDKAGAKYYSYTFPSKTYDTIKFSDGTAENKRTDNILYAADAQNGNNCYYLTGASSGGKYEFKPIQVDPAGLDATEMFTVYYKDTIGWGDPYLYAFSSTGAGDDKAYPGTRMTLEGTIGKTKIYSYSFDSNKFDRIKIDDGTILGCSVPNRRTADIDFINDLGENNCFELTGSTTVAGGKEYYDYRTIPINTEEITQYEGVKTDTKVKNVIFMIGDGFGEKQAQAGELYKGGKLVFRTGEENGWYRNWQTTHDADYPKFTDSAAAATALATGVKVHDSVVGISPGGKWVENLTEFSKARGLKTGIVVTQVLPHATPAGFTAHVDSRHSYDEIATQQVKQNIDLMFGGGSTYFNARKSLMNDLGYSYVTNFSDVSNVPADQKLIGAFKDSYIKHSDSNLPMLADTTKKALERLTNDDGFFVMIEGSDIDAYAHNSNMADMLDEIIVFDNAVKVAQQYVDEHPDTLLIVTADHETGGLDLSGVTDKSQLTNGLFKSGGTHTGQSVPLYAYGKGAQELTQYNTIDNTEIHQFVTDVLNNEYDPNGEIGENVLSDANNVIYFQKPADWEDVYIYSDAYNSTKEFPGAPMILLEGDIYTYTIPYDVKNLAFSFNDGNKKSTVTVENPQYNKLYYIDDDKDPQKSTVAVNDEYAPPEGVVYFEKPDDWKDAYIYTWGSRYGGTWPGAQMTHVEGSLYKYVLYGSTTIASAFGLIFNEGPNSTKQTVDLEFMGFNLLYRITGEKDAQGHFYTSFEKYPKQADDGEDAGTFYFRKPASWDSANVYAFFGAYVGEWSGVPMTKVTDDIYSFTLKKGQMFSGGHNFKLAFNDGKTYQTVDVAFEGFDRIYTIEGDDMTEAAYGSWSKYTPAEFKYGDLNGDGEVTVADVLIVQQYLARMIELTDAQKRAADVDLSGDIKVADVLEMQKLIAKIIDKLPAERAR